MDSLRELCGRAFPSSRKLRGLTPTNEQLDNVVMRLGQIFNPDELARIDEIALVRQVERVWPIARYVDRKD